MLSHTVSHTEITRCVRPRLKESFLSVPLSTLGLLVQSRRNGRGSLRCIAREDGVSAKELTHIVSQLELLSLSSAQAELGVSRSTVYRLIKEGELDRVHIRTRARVTRESMDRYLTYQIELARIARSER